MRANRKNRWAMCMAVWLMACGLAAGCGQQSSQAPSAEETETAAVQSQEMQETEKKAASQDQITVDETIAGWHFQVENVRVDTSMQNVSVDLGYSGVETSEFVKEAQEGKTFCIVKLKIEKDGSREQIDWEKMILTDDQGRQYQRIEDSFIADLGMKHMPGSSLNFGSHEGWIAYEIDEDAKGLELSYAFEEETLLTDLGF